MVGVGVVITIGNSWDHTKLLTVFLRKLTTQALSRRSQYRVVMMILLAEVVDTLTHITHDLQTKRLTLFALTMMLTRKRYQALCQSNETDTQCTLIDHTLYRIVGTEFVGTDPQTLHQQGELLGKGRLLELEAVIELLGSQFKHVVEFGKEHIDTFLLILFLTTLEGQFHDVNGRERQVTTTDTGLRSEAVLEHTGTTTHRGHLMDIALRIVSTPLTILIIRGIEVQEVGEETTRRHLTSQLIEIEVTILRQVVHTTFLLPDLNGEDGGLTIAHTLIGRKQDLTHDATALCTCICTIVDRREHHLVTTS